MASTSMHRPVNVWTGTSGQRRLTVAIEISPKAKYAAVAATNKAGYA
jgi:hypothetical protein